MLVSFAMLSFLCMYEREREDHFLCSFDIVIHILKIFMMRVNAVAYTQSSLGVFYVQ